MQKKLIALAIASAISVPAFADNANVTIYGKIDVNLESVRNDIGANATTQPLSVTRVATNASRFGIKGSEDLGDDIKGIYQVEVQFDANGNSGNGLGNGTRNTGVGLEGGFGRVIFGNWDTPYKVAHNKVELFDNAHFASTTSLIGRSAGAAAAATTFGGAASFNTRLKNSIQYNSPNFSGFAANLAFGTDNAPAAATSTTVATNKTVLSLSGVYENEMFYLAAANEQHNDEAVPTTLALAKGRNSATRLVGAYKLGEAGFVGVTVENMSISTIAAGVVTSNSRRGTELSASYKLDAHRIGVAYAKMGDLGNNPNTGATQVSLRYGYNFSKRTEAYAMYSKISNKLNGLYDFSAGNTVGPATLVGAARTGLGFGVAHSF
jgi:predicted porin